MEMLKAQKQSNASGATATPLDDDQLIAIVDGEINNALGRYDTQLSTARLRAMQYYLGDKVGNLAPPESEGRSTVVSMDVADTIEWILPSLIRIFTGGDKAVEFQPRGVEDTNSATQATEWCNYVFYSQNEGFIILHDWFKDALLQKLGIVKTWWDTSIDVSLEDYNNVSLDELTLLAQDDSVQIAAKTDNGDGTFNVKLRKTAKSSHVCIENVPPEEFLVSRKARTPQRLFSCHHRVQKTVSELRSMGYQNVDDLMSDEGGAEFSQEAIERESETNEYVNAATATQSLDKTMRFVWVTESYLQVDYNGDGVAEWRKVVKCGKVLLLNEEVDGHPFSMLTPIKMPHKLIGRSVADLVMDLQEIKTALTRQIIDNMYLQNNARTYVNESAGVNIDDLLDNRVGGIVRGKTAGGLEPIVTQPLGAMSLNLLNYIDQVKQGRTGVSGTFQGLDANEINKTATGVNALMNAAQARIELIARIFAETGVKDLFKKILKLSAQYQNEQQVMRLTNKFVPVDPRSWKTQFDMTVNVGIGTGNKDQIAAHVMGLMNIQKEAMQGGIPIVDAKRIYNAAAKYATNVGFRNPEEFFIDPESEQGQQMAQQSAQAKPDPKMLEVQAKSQQAQAELQLKAQDSQVNAQLAHGKLQLQGAQAQTEAQLKSAALQNESRQLDIEEHRLLVEIHNALKPGEEPKPQNKNMPDGYQVTKTPEALAMEDAHHADTMTIEQQKLILEEAELQQQQMDMQQRNEQAQALIQALSGIQQQLAALAQPKPIKVIRDANGQVTGAV